MKQLSSLILAASVFLFSCNNSTESADKNTTTKMGITEKSFGSFENQAVTEYTLTNANGMQVGIINYGGAITKILTKDKEGTGL
jgi:aldose 1-epimerase